MTSKDGNDDEPEDDLEDESEEDQEDESDDDIEEEPRFVFKVDADSPTDFNDILKHAVSNPLQDAMDRISFGLPNDPLQNSIDKLSISLPNDSLQNSISDLSITLSNDALAGIAAQNQLSGVESLTLPVADNTFLSMQNLTHDTGADLWESLKQNASFNASIASQLALSDAVAANESIRLLLEQSEAASLQLAKSNIAEMWNNLPTVEIEDWKGLLSGSKSLDIHARVRATAAAERYIDFSNLTDLDSETQISVVPDNADSDDDDEEYVGGVAEVEDFEDVSVQEASEFEHDPLQLRADLASLVNQTEGIHTTILKVIVGDKESTFVEFGFHVGGLSTAASRVALQTVIDERENLESQDFQMYKVWIGVIAGIIGGLLAGLKLSG